MSAFGIMRCEMQEEKNKAQCWESKNESEGVPPFITAKSPIDHYYNINS